MCGYLKKRWRHYMNKDALDLLYKRRSIRSFTDTQIQKEELDAVLKAGILAPCAMNRQTTLMVVVQSQIYRDALVELKNAGTDKDPFYGAPTIIVLFAPANHYTAIENASAVQMNLMHAANAVGLASCWVHMPKEVFQQVEGKQLMYAWGLPDDVISVAALAIGYQDGETPEVPDKEQHIVISV